MQPKTITIAKQRCLLFFASLLTEFAIFEGFLEVFLDSVTFWPQMMAFFKRKPIKPDNFFSFVLIIYVNFMRVFKSSYIYISKGPI